MASLRALTVTAATGLCLLGTGLPAAYADTTGTTTTTSVTTRTVPWKHSGGRRFITPTSAAVATVKAPAPTVTVVDPAVTFAARIATLVNAQRASAGLPALRVSSCATGFATTWSRHMAATRDFSHQSLSPIMTGCGARGAGENIAYGAATPEQFMTMWMNSAGHRANILRASFTHIGVGVARTSAGTWYATQDFLTV